MNINLKLCLNLKNLMSGPGLHIPAIFAMDARLNAKDLLLLAIMFTYINSSNGQCMPSDEQLSQSMGFTTETVRALRNKLCRTEYLSWELINGKKNSYEFSLPYDSKQWIESLNWQDPYFGFTEESFGEYLQSILNGILTEDETTKKIRVVINHFNNTNTNINKIDSINKEGSKPPKKSGWLVKNNHFVRTDKRLPKNGRKQEQCLTDSESEYYEDNSQATLLLINTYSTWLARRSGGKSHGPAFLQPNSTYYKYFVKLRKKLIAFRGNRNSPNLQSLFWDFFRFIGDEFDNRGWSEPYIKQMPSDGVWEVYANYLAHNFPNGSYWWETEYSIDENGKQHIETYIPVVASS